MNFAAVRVPGMDAALAGADTGGFDTFRIGPNDWGVLVTDPVGLPADAAATAAAVARRAVHGYAQAAFLPSASLMRLNDVLLQTAGADEGEFCAAVFARLELDKCGAWITLASAGHPRPIVVRRAGWIDVRGHVGLPLGLLGGIDVRDDRVGLGPGDALVLVTDALVYAADSNGELFGDELLVEALLDCAGARAEALAAHVLDAARQFAAGPLRNDAAALVVRVPEEGDRDPILRVVEATGVAAEDLRLPGYPLGDEQPDLWKQPPAPPRQARIRLEPVAASLPRMREVLRRLLRSWRMEEAGDGVIELLATELAANVVKHAGSDMTVIVRYLGPVVRIEVGDGSRELPRPRVADDEDMDGRGLALIEALAQDWGVLPTRTGKRVWCDIAVAAAAS
ncbi:MAG: hypothetical protein QOK43_970 [Acidimicrobiaceae bacterium]|nr:hypothetical protein [Acidimicrobiaceae bacterium]